MELLRLIEEKGSEKDIAALLDGGADPNAADSEGFTALTKAIVADSEDVVRLLLDRGAQVDTAPMTHTAVRAATLHGRWALLRVLLERGADARILSKHGRSALMGACSGREGVASRDRAACVRLLLEDARGRESVRFANSDGDTALHLACRHPDNLEVAKLLLEAGADVDAPNLRGETPRRLARESGLDLGKLLPCALVEQACGVH